MCACVWLLFGPHWLFSIHFFFSAKIHNQVVVKFSFRNFTSFKTQNYFSVDSVLARTDIDNGECFCGRVIGLMVLMPTPNSIKREKWFFFRWNEQKTDAREKGEDDKIKFSLLNQIKVMILRINLWASACMLLLPYFRSHLQCTGDSGNVKFTCITMFMSYETGKQRNKNAKGMTHFPFIYCSVLCIRLSPVRVHA